MGLCVSPTATLRKLDVLAIDHDQPVMEWKRDIELSMVDPEQGV